MCSDKPPAPGGRFLEATEEAGDRRGCSPEQALRGLPHRPRPKLDPRSPQATHRALAYINHDAGIG